MARGGKGNNNNKDTGRGGPPNRGRGRGGFRGGRGGGGRGRGRGGGPGPQNQPLGGPGSSMLVDDLGFVDRMYGGGPNSQQQAPATPRGRGRGRGAPTPTFTSRGGGRGRGIGSPMGPRGTAPGLAQQAQRNTNLAPSLSSLLQRPLLRPIAFVPSQFTKVLFADDEDEEEDIEVAVKLAEELETTALAAAEATVDDTEYNTHAPTADAVMKVFTGGFSNRAPSEISYCSSDNDDGAEELEEFDFSDLSKLMEATPAASVKKKINGKIWGIQEDEERFTGVSIKPSPAHVVEVSTAMAVDTTPPVAAPIFDASTIAETITTEAEPTPTDTALPEPLVEEAPAVIEIEADPPLPLALPSFIPIPDPVQPSDAESALDPELSAPLFVVDTEPAPGFVIHTQPAASQDHASLDFVIDTDPSPPSEVAIQKPRIKTPPPIGHGADEDDEVIVYVAPHPRKAAALENQDAATTAAKEASDTGLFTPYEPVRSGVAAVASTSPPKATVASNFSFSFASPAKPAGTPRLQVPAIATPRVNKKAMKRLKQRARRKNKQKEERQRIFGGGGGGFGGFGAMMQEKELHDEYDFHHAGEEFELAGGKAKDPKFHLRRKGDSDLDWGDEDDEGAEEETGMQVDEDIDLDAMQRFVGGLLGKNAGVHETFGDLEDRERIRQEDEDEDARGSSGESDSDEDDIISKEEKMLVEEFDRAATLSVSDDDDDDDNDDDDEEDIDDDELEFNEALEMALALDEDESDDDDDDDEDEDEDEDETTTPRTKFANRLQKLRERATASSKKGKGRAVDFDDDDDDMLDLDDKEEDARFQAMLNKHMGWAAEQDDYDELALGVQEILDQNADILQGRNRKERKKLFKAISEGTFDYEDDYDDMENWFPRAKRGKDKRNAIPAALQAQWDKDRAKKAAFKAQREVERLERAMDPFSSKKGGKKGRKAMLNAAAASSSPAAMIFNDANPIVPTTLAPSNRIIDMSSLIQMLRRFVADIGGKQTMSLPPTSKETRKNVHELAIAFGLKSVSKGKGDARYVTLSKTTRTGAARVDEKKVARIIQRAGGPGGRGNDFGARGDFSGGRGGGGGGGGRGQVPKHREGEQVGGKAPKIDASNVGFRMLAMMGWAEGQTIGGVGSGGDGLADPLVAIVKHSKLGLGATRF